MSATRMEVVPMHCDGCRREATPEHLRHRIARLELASRFRPVRIGTLFLTPAPPTEVRDFFYFPEGRPSDPTTRSFHEDLLQACGISRNETGHESALDDFQHAGCYLAECVECPMGSKGGGGFDAVMDSLLATLERRIRFSYRPRAIVLISKKLTKVAEALGRARLGTELLLWKGAPVSLPEASDSAGRERFRAEVASLMASGDKKSA